jgi:MoxR-like ATPase
MTSVVDVTAMGDRLRASVRAAVEVSEPTLEVVLATLFAGGHLLIEDHPGVGKTVLARALAASVGGRLTRIQATIDLLPADIVGANVWRPEEGRFHFQPGPVFANVVLVDEINRATPKTQSGLLESMEEREVTVDGETRPISPPFMVIATQNPSAGQDGTYALPPASHDRFLARVSLGYPSPSAEMRLLGDEPRRPVTVATREALLSAQATVAAVYASERLLRYVIDLLAYTRQHERIAVGGEPASWRQAAQGGTRARRPAGPGPRAARRRQGPRPRRSRPPAADRVGARRRRTRGGRGGPARGTGHMTRPAALILLAAALAVAGAALPSLALFAAGCVLTFVNVGALVCVLLGARTVSLSRRVPLREVEEDEPRRRDARALRSRRRSDRRNEPVRRSR